MISWTSMVFVVISPFAFLILLIWVFSLLILVRFARGLSILFTKMSIVLKTQNQRTGQQNRSCLGGWCKWEGEGYGERE
jgi:hypothetical protein